MEPKLMTTFSIGGISYGPEETEELRKLLIAMRDKALQEGDMNTTVYLTHTVGLLHVMGKRIWGK